MVGFKVGRGVLGRPIPGAAGPPNIQQEFLMSSSLWLGLAGLALFGCAAVASAVLGGLARRYAPALGLLDRPGGHKAHAAPVPLWGGVAIWLALLCTLALAAGLLPFLPPSLAQYAAGAYSQAGRLLLILGMATVILIMGFADDRYNLDWRIRLGIQLATAIVVVLGGVRITLFGPFTHPLLGGLVTVFWIAGLTNSFNMLDNMDGLAAGVGLVVALLFSGAQIAVASLFAPAVLIVLAGGLAGFLVHNHAPARLYMGDAGSNFLGFLLGSLTVAGTFTRDPFSPYSAFAPLLVMAVPLYDMTTVIVIRLLEGRSPFQGDRRHFSHRLVAHGLTPPQAVWTIILITLTSGMGALLLHRMDGWGACVLLAQTGFLLGVVAILEFSAVRAGEADDQTRDEQTGDGRGEIHSA